LILLITWSLAIYIVYRQHILPWTWDIHSIDWWLNPLVRSTGADRWLIPVAILGRYAALLIFPWRLSPDYSASVFMPHLQWSSPYFYLGIATLLAYGTACVIAFMRRSAPALFALACLGMSYFLVGNFVLIGTIFGERLIYLPSAFFLILLAMAMRQLPPRWLAGLMAVALLLASLRTVTYAARWNDPMRFFQQSLQEQPDNVQLGMVYAMKLYHLGDLAGAQQAINQACQHTPDCWKAWYLSAMVALDRGDRPQALRCYEKADQLDGAKTAFFGLKSRLYAPATQPH
jgi:tetratricopeptide (TPR) repeat protein